VEIEELRAEVRRGEQRLRTAHRDMKAQQDKAELHSKFSTQYLAELEDLRTKHSQLQARGSLLLYMHCLPAIMHAPIVCAHACLVQCLSGEAHVCHTDRCRAFCGGLLRKHACCQ
jgi:hypothetical protein